VSEPMKTWLTSLSPRARLLLALGLLLGLAGWAQGSGVSVTAWARAMCGALALALLGGWWMRREREGSRFPLAEPLRVVSRAGLSPRCGLALVEAEGSRYVVVFGDSFAEIHPARVPTRVGFRPRRRAERPVQVKEPLS
jgi:flagellar protein FliO/FliZ